jgi:iron uptake system EfeUOB component EfeO/EfeM
VADLRRSFPDDQTDPNDLPLRAHEILEDSLQSELTDAADQGSGTGLATVAANLVGTRAVLDAIGPVFSSRYADWGRVGPSLSHVDTILAGLRRPDGTWPAVTALAPTDRERLAGAMGDLLETLAPIAAIGDVRRTT